MNKCKSEGMLHKKQHSPLLCMWMHVRAEALNPLTGLQGVLSFVHSFLSTHVCGLQRCQGPCLGLQRNGFSIGQVHKAEGYVVILPLLFLSNAMFLLKLWSDLSSIQCLDFRLMYTAEMGWGIDFWVSLTPLVVPQHPQMHSIQNI